MTNFRAMTAALSLGVMVSSANLVAAPALEVNGTVFPGACDLTLSLPKGEINYGIIPLSDLDPTGDTLLAPKGILANVTCVQPTKIAFELKDNRSDSIAEPASGTTIPRYGLGLSPNDAKIGSYEVAVLTLFADDSGTRMTLLSKTLTGNWERPPHLDYFSADRMYAGAYAPALDEPVSVQRLQMMLSIRATINADQGMTFAEDINLNGSAVLEMIYL